VSSILQIVPQLQWPAQQGSSLRNLGILRILAAQHSVHVLGFVEPGAADVAERTAALSHICEGAWAVPLVPRTSAARLRQFLTSSRPDLAHRLNRDDFHAVLGERLGERRFDIVQVEGLEMAPYVDTIRRCSPSSRIVLDCHNLESALQGRALATDAMDPRRWPAALYSLVQAHRLRRYERAACRSVDALVAVSEADAAGLRVLAPGRDIVVLPNGIDPAGASPTAVDGPAFDLVFTGKMDYRPNVDAVLWFAEQVWPRIRARRPQTTWAVVGQQPHRRLARLRRLPGVEVTGWVASVAPYLAGAAVCILPLRYGGGSRLKLVEAMAAGKAVVATPAGAEGFPVAHDRELRMAADAGAFAAQVLDLLEDPAARQRLGAQACRFAADYDWLRLGEGLCALYRRLLD
jgi:polysaccharide biosynthesis protein PslH